MKTQSITSTTSTVRALFAFACALALTPACIDASDDDAAPTRTEDPVADDTIFVETVVEVGPDGSVVVHDPHTVTAGVQRAQNEIRLAVERGELSPPVASAYANSACPSDSFWLYSRTDWTGDRICFSGAGTVSPAAYPRYIYIGGVYVGTGTWSISSGSYWPGVHGGTMGNRLDYLDPPSTQIWTNYFLQWGAQQILGRPSPMEYITFQ